MRLFNLRFHHYSISYILPIGSYLYTADSGGNIIKWDLNTRRPILNWKAHDDTILTLIEFDIYIISHSKDSSIKIWKEDELVFEFPVNSLNFTNILLVNEYLIVPASGSSENIDVYRIETEPFKFIRVVENFEFYENAKGFRIEEIGGRGGFGIIMKMYYLNESIYIGFENGTILGLNLIKPSSKLITSKNDITMINKDLKLEIMYQNDSHSPNPVISLGSVGDNLVSGSTNNTLVSHEETPIITNLIDSGIQSVSSFEKDIYIGCWNGVVLKNNHTYIQRELPKLDNIEMKPTMKLSYMRICQPMRNKSIKLKDAVLLIIGYEDGTLSVYKIN